MILLLLFFMSGSEIIAAEKETDASTASAHTELVKAYVQNFNVAQFLADPAEQKLSLEYLHALRKLLPYEKRDQIWHSLAEMRAGRTKDQRWRPLAEMRAGAKNDWDFMSKTHEDLMGCSISRGRHGYSVTSCSKCKDKTPDEQTRCANRIGFIVNPALRKLLSENESLTKLAQPLVAMIADYAAEE